jgi:hypothetical protein
MGRSASWRTSRTIEAFIAPESSGHVRRSVARFLTTHCGSPARPHDAGAYSFEAANARHEHEYHLWERVTLSEAHPTVVWAKFHAMAAGARLASAQLWR